MSPSPFPIPSTTRLPVFTDNVLPSLLIHLGVIDLSANASLSHLFPDAGSPEKLESLLAVAPKTNEPDHEDGSKSLPQEGPILTPSQAYTLRAAAIDACELIVDAARSHTFEDPSMSDMQLPDLDMWIWAIAKDRADYRQLTRFVWLSAAAPVSTDMPFAARFVLRDTVFF